jgi:hypothetical protein
MAEHNEINELPDENIYEDELVNTEEQDELFEPVEEILPEEPIEEEHQHEHAPVIVEEEEPEGYNDEGCEENNNELDEEAINSFILQLFQLKKIIF